MKRYQTLLATLALLASAPLAAQHEPVVGVDDPESLFTDEDPQLHENKQASLHIMRELLQCNYWDRAGEWLTERYIQHHPGVQSGLDSVVQFFSSVTEPAERCEELTTPITAVMAEDDLVTVIWPAYCVHPETGESYTTTWFDTWRFVDGRADEHWDPAVAAAVDTGCSPGAPPEA